LGALVSASLVDMTRLGLFAEHDIRFLRRHRQLWPHLVAVLDGDENAAPRIFSKTDLIGKLRAGDSVLASRVRHRRVPVGCLLGLVLIDGEATFCVLDVERLEIRR
jgi:hypothetical protein